MEEISRAPVVHVYSSYVENVLYPPWSAHLRTRQTSLLVAVVKKSNTDCNSNDET